MRSLSILAVVVAGALTFAPSPALAQRRSADPMAGFDKYVTDAMKLWKVPGLAVAAVRGDSILFAKGYGVRTLGDPTPVDAHTLFAIGSASKAFTGALLEMASDDGKVNFDGRVTDYVPWFEMYDPWVTREIRVRDLLLHRSGLLRGDFIWYGTTATREDIIRSVRRLAPNTSFRTKFQYQNLMYLTAGEVIHQTMGQNWDDAVKSRIFGPLGMRESNTSVRDLAGQTNVASPHAEIDGVIKPVAWRNIDNAGPAGSINSNVTDMAQWLKLWANGGTYAGTRLLSEAMVKDAIAPQFTVNEPAFMMRLNFPNFLGYGYGWFVQDFRGRRMINHGGNIDGMAALVSFMPDEHLGIVVLTNMNQSDLNIPLTANLFDRLLGITPPKDYNTDYYAMEQAVIAKAKAAAGTPPHVEGTKPSLPLEAYVGTYRDSFMGTATVLLGANGALVFQYDASPGAVGELAHWHYDTFQAQMKDEMLGKIAITFRVGPDAKVAGLVFPPAGDGEWRKEK